MPHPNLFWILPGVGILSLPCSNAFSEEVFPKINSTAWISEHSPLLLIKEKFLGSYIGNAMQKTCVRSHPVSWACTCQEQNHSWWLCGKTEHFPIIHLNICIPEGLPCCLRRKLWHLQGNLQKVLVTVSGVAAHDAPFISSDDSLVITRVIVNN